MLDVQPSYPEPLYPDPDAASKAMEDMLREFTQVAVPQYQDQYEAYLKEREEWENAA